nr:MATE family efflux transporter [Clostridia bacterium]
MSQVTDMTSGKPAKLMLTFALPVIVTNFGQQLYQIVDAAIVGRGVGVDALAAVGCTDWTYWLIMWSMSVMTAGFATFVSRFFGSRDYVKMNRAIISMSVLSGVIALTLTVIGLVLARPLLVFLGTPDDILGDAVIYLSTMIAGTVIMTAYNLAGSILRAFGDGRSPLLAMITAAVLNILLDLLFVMVFKWGVFGAAAASVSSQLAAFVFCILRLRKIEYIKFDAEARKWDGKLALEILAFGLPLALQYVIINFGGMIVQSTINSQGSSFIAGYTATNKLYGLLECTAISFGNAYTTFASQNYGAGNYRRVRSGVNTAMILAVGAAL